MTASCSLSRLTSCALCIPATFHAVSFSQITAPFHSRWRKSTSHLFFSTYFKNSKAATSGFPLIKRRKKSCPYLFFSLSFLLLRRLFVSLCWCFKERLTLQCRDSRMLPNLSEQSPHLAGRLEAERE